VLLAIAEEDAEKIVTKGAEADLFVIAANAETAATVVKTKSVKKQVTTKKTDK